MGLVALPAMDPLPPPQPTRLAVQWISGRIDFHPMVFPLREARLLARAWSDSSPSVKRVWLEDGEGRLLYAAENGRGLPRKGSPMS